MTSLGCSERLHDRVKVVDAALPSVPEWKRVANAAPANVELFDLWMRVNGSEGWAVGTRNTFLHYDNARWHRDTFDSPGEIQWNSVAFSETTRRGYAVGSGGQIARYLGNHHWALVPAVTSDSLTSVWLDRGGLQGFAVGRGGVVLRLEHGQWSPVQLIPAPPFGKLHDVVANDRGLWVRDSSRVVEYSRPDLQIIRQHEDFAAMALWQQPNVGTIWMAGVQHHIKNDTIQSPGDGTGFTIRGLEGDRPDFVVSGIRHALHSAWMAPAPGCGIAAGGLPGEVHDWPLAAYVTRARTYFFETPDTVTIRSVWVNDTCTEGWGVGDRGFVGRWHLSAWKVDSLAWPDGDIKELTGHFQLTVDTLYGKVTLDSMRLLRGESSLKLNRIEHFSDSTVAGGLEFKFTDAGRSQVRSMFEGEEVRLRLFLTFLSSADTLRVAFEKDEPFKPFEPGLWQKVKDNALWIVSVIVLVVLVILFMRSGVLNDFWATVAGQKVLGGIPFALVELLVRRFDWVRRRRFARYLDWARREYATPPIIRAAAA